MGCLTFLPHIWSYWLTPEDFIPSKEPSLSLRCPGDITGERTTQCRQTWTHLFSRCQETLFSSLFCSCCIWSCLRRGEQGPDYIFPQLFL